MDAAVMHGTFFDMEIPLAKVRYRYCSTRPLPLYRTMSKSGIGANLTAEQLHLTDSF